MRILSLLAVFIVSLSFNLPQAESIEFPPPKYTTTFHTVKKGESLGVLAGYYMLNPRQWRKIREWNNGEIRGTRIYPGQELLIFINKKWEPPFDLDAYVKEWILGQRPAGVTESGEEIEVIQGPAN
jgi:LysM domain-containing protein